MQASVGVLSSRGSSRRRGRGGRGCSRGRSRGSSSRTGGADGGLARDLRARVGQGEGSSGQAMIPALKGGIIGLLCCKRCCETPLPATTAVHRPWQPLNEVLCLCQVAPPPLSHR